MRRKAAETFRGRRVVDDFAQLIYTVRAVGSQKLANAERPQRREDETCWREGSNVLYEMGVMKMNGRNGRTVFAVLVFLGCHLMGLALAYGIYGDDAEQEMAFLSGQIVVKFTAPPMFKGNELLGASSIDVLNRRFGVTTLRRVFKVNEPDLASVYELRFPREVDVQEMVADYQADAHVEYAEPTYVYHLCYIPNDPLFSRQWGLHNTGQQFTGLRIDEGSFNALARARYGTPDADIDAPEAWDVGGYRHPVLVGVIDTGLDFDHPELVGRFWINDDEVPDNGVDDDRNGYIDDHRGWDFVGDSLAIDKPRRPDNDPSDSHGHGTHCAGIIAAISDNGVGVAGISDKTRLLPIKCFTSQGVSVSSSLAEGIVYAADNGADIISMSWGGIFTSRVLEDALDYASDKGVLPVAAMGNYRPPWLDIDTPIYPAAYRMVMAVGASDDDDHRAWWSVYGAHLDVLAPGVDVLSLRAAGTDMYGDGHHIVEDDYYLASGTSMACPHVAGVGALLLSRSPGLSADSIRSLICRTTDDLFDPNDEGDVLVGWDVYSGWGRLNVWLAAAHLSEVGVLIASPEEEQVVSGMVLIRGTALGGVWTLEYGHGVRPTQWTEIVSSSEPVEDGLLAQWGTDGLDGRYTLRLSVRGIHEDRVGVKVANAHLVEIVAPQDGTTARNFVRFRGSASSPEFSRYRIEYGVGENPALWQLIAESWKPAVDTILALWTLGPLSEGIYTCRLVVESQSCEDADSLRVWVANTYQPGWPQEFLNFVRGSVALGDIDDDGREEVVFASKGVYAWNHDGTRAGVWPQDTDKEAASNPVLGDLDGDGYMEVVVCCRDDFGQGSVNVYRYDGKTAYGWPRSLTVDLFTAPGWFTSPTIGDIDGDGLLEVLAVDFCDKDVYVWHHDGSSFLPGREGLFGTTPLGSGSPNINNPVTLIGDIDGDGDNEVISTIGRSLHVWNADGIPFTVGSGLFKNFHQILGAALGDLDADGVLEVVVLGERPEDENFTISVLNADGSQVDGWPVLTPIPVFYCVFGPVLGDLDGNGRPEVVISGITSIEGDGCICVWRHDGKPLADPWGTEDGRLVLGSFGIPSLADVDDDGAVDIVARACIFGYGYEEVHAFDLEGQLLEGWPLYASWPSARYFDFNPPALGDLDKDGDIEVAMEASFETRLYVWDLPAAYHEDRVEWGMLLHDRWNSGVWGFNPGSQQEGIGEDLVHQAPASYSLGRNFPNPFNATTVIPYLLPPPHEGGRKEKVILRIFNSLGQVVRTLVNEPQTTGSHRAVWDGKDDWGREVASGVYLYRLRAGNYEMTKRMIVLR